MTPDEINKAIAKELGWYLIEPPDEDGTRAFSLREPVANTLYPWHRLSEEAWSDCPDYTNDLNAMHEAEKGLSVVQWALYDGWLCRVVLGDIPKGLEELAQGNRMLIHATARQRAEAFLRTLGKWKE